MQVHPYWRRHATAYTRLKQAGIHCICKANRARLREESCASRRAYLHARLAGGWHKLAPQTKAGLPLMLHRPARLLQGCCGSTYCSGCSWHAWGWLGLFSLPLTLLLTLLPVLALTLLPVLALPRPAALCALMLQHLRWWWWCRRRLGSSHCTWRAAYEARRTEAAACMFAPFHRRQHIGRLVLGRGCAICGCPAGYGCALLMVLPGAAGDAAAASATAACIGQVGQRQLLLQHAAAASVSWQVARVAPAALCSWLRRPCLPLLILLLLALLLSLELVLGIESLW